MGSNRSPEGGRGRREASGLLVPVPGERQGWVDRLMQPGGWDLRVTHAASWRGCWRQRQDR